MKSIMVILAFLILFGPSGLGVTQPEDIPFHLRYPDYNL